VRKYWLQRWKSFGYAFAGLATLFRTQAHAWIHLIAALIVISLAFYFGVSRTEWCILLLCITLVFAAEAFNTAVEFLTDLASPNIHPLAKYTKDTAAAAVLICSIGAAIVGSLVFWPYVSIFLEY